MAANLGEAWKAGLRDRKVAEDTTKAQAERAEADKEIDKIPDLVTAAIDAGNTSVRVLSRWLHGGDVTHQGGVDGLWEAYSHVRTDAVLREAHFRGAALFIFQWCMAQGLVVEIRAVDKIPLNGREYSLFAKTRAVKLFTALFRHVYPMITWGEVPGYESYPENVKSELYYGPDAGKPTDKMHLRVFAAKSVAEVAFLCEADAIGNYGTQVLCIWEGDLIQSPALLYTSEPVLTLPEADAEQRTRCA